MVIMLMKSMVTCEVGVGVLPNREGRRCYSGLWPWYRYQQWWWCRRGDVVYLGSSTDEVDDEGSRHRVNSCHVVNSVGGGWVRGDSMKNWIFGVVVIVLGLNSRDYFAKFFIRKNCVLGECLCFNVEYVKRFRIWISRKFDVFEIVDGFRWRQLAVSSCWKCFTRCEESVFKLEKRCIQSFDPSSSLTVLEFWRCRNAQPKQDFEVRLSGRLSRSGAPHITSLASWILWRVSWLVSR